MIAMVLTMGAAAQDAAQPIDLHLAGVHIEKAGKQRTTAILVGIASGAVAYAGATLSDADQVAMPIALAGIGFGFSVGLNIGAAGHEKKAGRILQAK